MVNKIAGLRPRKAIIPLDKGNVKVAILENR